MDTKPLEIQAESIIQHELIKYGFQVSKPTFDKEGADLIVIDDIKNKFTKSIRIQCKGRTIGKNTTSIEIPTSYADDNFIVFIYTINENMESNLYVYFYEDILNWKINNGKYVLNISQSKISSGQLSDFSFSKEKAKKIEDEINKSPIKKYTTILIDENYLNEAINKTIKIYQDIYPKRKFLRPSQNEAIKSILSMYDNFKTNDKSINCHIYSYKENVPAETNVSKLSINTQTTAKLHREITDQFVSFEMLDHLNRVINSENIILVSNDVLFDDVLELLKEKGVDVTMVLYSSHEGRNIYATHMWGDIIYPLAQSIGLQKHEW